MEKIIPYGLAYFKDVIGENYYYVDKPHYLPLLEKVKTRVPPPPAFWEVSIYRNAPLVL